MNVGELKKILNKLPDDAEIYPDWFDGPPGDNDPAVTLCGFAVREYEEGKYLSVLVDIQYLDEFDGLDDDEDEEDDDA